MYVIALLYLKVPQDFFPFCYNSFHLQEHLKVPESYMHKEVSSWLYVSLKF